VLLTASLLFRFTCRRRLSVFLCAPVLCFCPFSFFFSFFFSSFSFCVQMGRFITTEIKRFARSFIVFQTGQPDGLPQSKTELEACYDHYTQLQPAGTSVPFFSDIFIALNIMWLVRPGNTPDAIIYINKNKVCKKILHLQIII
jgi:hypothetical protein